MKPLTTYLPQRDQLQLQLAELLSASSKYGAEIEKLELEYEKTLAAQEEKFEGELQKKRPPRRAEHNTKTFLMKKQARKEQIDVLQHPS